MGFQQCRSFAMRVPGKLVMNAGTEGSPVIFLHLQMYSLKEKKMPLEFFTNLNPIDASPYRVLPSNSHAFSS